MTHKNTHRKKIKINILGSGRHENLRATSKICGLHEQLSLLRQVTFLALKGYNKTCRGPSFNLTLKGENNLEAECKREKKLPRI